MKNQKDKMKVREISALRKTMSKIRPVERMALDQFPNSSQIKHSYIVESVLLPQINALNSVSKAEDMNQLAVNKIYNNKNPLKEDLSKGFRNKRLSCSYKNMKMDKLGNNLTDVKMRPQSNHTGKAKPSQIFKSNSDVLNCETRPGSSKSSRFFKSKYQEEDSLQMQNPIKTINMETENDEFDLLIRISSNIQEKKVNKGHQHIRIGTSSNKGYENIINSKLDPTFFKLFAK